jgi:8-oxo-(d)GTP phosphatase
MAPRRPLLVRAAGGIVWREGPTGTAELAVIHRPKYGDWSLPKGKLEPGEGFREAALREVEEETGCRARLLHFAGFTYYFVRRRAKVVLFWHMRQEGKARFEPSAEVDRMAWCSAEEALARLGHPAERRIVLRATCGKARAGA